MDILMEVCFSCVSFDGRSVRNFMFILHIKNSE